MLFTSAQFMFVFLPVTLAVFFLIPVHWRATRKVWLCLASLFFYGYWKPEYLPLLLGSILFNFTMGGLLVRWRGRSWSRVLLALAVAVNLLLLGYFKYTNFL